VGIFDFLTFFKTPYETITPMQAKERQSEGALVIDVRTASEQKSGIIAGAKRVPLTSLLAQADLLPKDREVIAVCARGGRSASAARLLHRQGFERVSSVKGGMTGWKAQGLKVVAP